MISFNKKDDNKNIEKLSLVVEEEQNIEEQQNNYDN